MKPLWRSPASEHFSCHNLRHTFTTRMVEAGVNVKVIQDALGHQDIQTTMNIYADVTKELKKSEFDGLDGFFRKNREANQPDAMKRMFKDVYMTAKRSGRIHQSL